VDFFCQFADASGRTGDGLKADRWISTQVHRSHATSPPDRKVFTVQALPACHEPSGEGALPSRYISRPLVSNQRLSLTANGNARFQ
jgi:hypothetical protein